MFKTCLKEKFGHKMKILLFTLRVLQHSMNTVSRNVQDLPYYTIDR